MKEYITILSKGIVDGFVVHLVSDKHPTRRICDGEEWEPPGEHDLVVVFCPVCERISRERPFATEPHTCLTPSTTAESPAANPH